MKFVEAADLTQGNQAEDVPCRISLPSLSWLRYAGTELAQAVLVQGNSSKCRRFSAMAFSCIDLVIAALGVSVEGYLLAHTFAAPMGNGQVFPLLFSQGFFLHFFRKSKGKTKQ